MSIRYQPDKVLKRLARKKNVEKLLTKKLSVNRTALNAIQNNGILSKKELENAALKVIKDYKRRAREMRKLGASEAEIIRELYDDPRQLVQRVQNATITEVTNQIQKKYHGEFYKWLPSIAQTPDKEHMKKYGKKYQFGKGEQPGQRIGCQCGMLIYVKGSKLTITRRPNKH